MSAFGESTEAASSSEAASGLDGPDSSQVPAAAEREQSNPAASAAAAASTGAPPGTTAAPPAPPAALARPAGGLLCAGTLEAPRAVCRGIGDGVRTRLLAGRRRRSNAALASAGGASLYGRHVAALAAEEGGAYVTAPVEPELTGSSDSAESDGATLPASDLADPTRRVVVVTTAALPWRTGTAVNPLLRALYLIRHQDERRRLLESGDGLGDPSGPEGDEEECGVTLAVPWLESSEDRSKLYGRNDFPDGRDGMAAQEDWIRRHAAARCGMPDEARRLGLLFYPAFYLSGFGSIFPKVDLCRHVSDAGHDDVAILEEPEHLNWFRTPGARERGSGRGQSGGDGAGFAELELKESAAEEDAEIGEGAEGSAQPRCASGVFGQKVEVPLEHVPSDELTVEVDPDAIGRRAGPSNEETDGSDPRPPKHDGEAPSEEESRRKDEAERLARATKLGWTHRFRYVVGVVHTNYEAYARRYGVGAQLIAGPAIGAVSALTIRAHCHQVVKLSGALPRFAPGKELTCNVHGVRAEFLEPADPAGGDAAGGSGTPSPVYFIGKLVWAKGFDVMLDLQDVYRRRNGAYFDVDIYGGGPEQREIARAFHGRNHRSPEDRPESPRRQQQQQPALARSGSRQDVSAAAVLDHPESIRDQSARVIERLNERRIGDGGEGYDVIAEYLSLGFEVAEHADGAGGESEVTYVRESRDGGRAGRGGGPPSGGDADRRRNPLAIIGELSGQSIHTTVKTSQAVYDIADSSIKNILNMSFSQLRNRKEKKEIAGKQSGADDAESTENEERHGDAKDAEEPKFVFDPPASRFEWRRHPIPARFPGVVDHAALRGAGHKIFLNPSTSEVLCTTSAEALAMNKFVILPRHPSNAFFEGFANCLAYDTLEECAERMEWALANDPAPLSEEERRRFTWEAATERLVESSAVTVGQARERSENGMDRTDERIAYWLAESGEKSSLIKGFLNREGKG